MKEGGSGQTHNIEFAVVGDEDGCFKVGTIVVVLGGTGVFEGY